MTPVTATQTTPTRAVETRAWCARIRHARLLGRNQNCLTGGLFFVFFLFSSAPGLLGFALLIAVAVYSLRCGSGQNAPGGCVARLAPFPCTILHTGGVMGSQWSASGGGAPESFSAASKRETFHSSIARTFAVALRRRWEATCAGLTFRASDAVCAGKKRQSHR